MTDYSQAIQDLTFIGNRLKNVLEVIPELTKISSLEVSIQEAERQVSSLQDRISDTKIALASEVELVKKATARVKEKIAEGDEVLRVATEKATQYSSGLIDSANITASEIQQAAQDASDLIYKKVVQGQADLVTTLEDVGKAQAELDALIAEISRIKSRF